MMSWLTDRDITDKIQYNASPTVLDMFSGIYSIDTLPKTIFHYPTFIVINTHTKNLPGEHWKAILIKEDRSAEVFDSLASQLNVHTENWLNKYTRRWKTNTQACQHPLSATCGAYVLYFILNRLKYSTFEIFVMKNFSSNVLVNERMINTFYNNLY